MLAAFTKALPAEDPHSTLPKARVPSAGSFRAGWCKKAVEAPGCKAITLADLEQVRLVPAPSGALGKRAGEEDLAAPCEP